jgi:hypothetical protein
MTKRIARVLSFLLAPAFLLLAGCGRSTDSRPSPDPVKPSSAASSDRIKIKTPDERAVVEFDVKADEARIEFNSGGQTKVLRGDLKDTGKRKYELEGGGLVAEVKSDADSFKVRSPEGKLLWKVKLADDKIKISDNEEGNNAYVVESKSAGRTKVFQNTQEIGKVNFYPDRGKVKVKNATENELFESNTSRHSAMYAILLMDRMAESERYIIMAELLARGR